MENVSVKIIHVDTLKDILDRLEGIDDSDTQVVQSVITAAVVLAYGHGYEFESFVKSSMSAWDTAPKVFGDVSDGV